MRFLSFLLIPFLFVGCKSDDVKSDDTAAECGDDTDTAVDTGETVDTGDTADTSDTGSDTGDTVTDPVDTGSDTGAEDTGTEDTGGDTAETPPA